MTTTDSHASHVPATAKRYGHWIAGREVPGSGKPITSSSPWDGSVVAEIAGGTASDVDAAVVAARSGLAQWRNLKQGERGQVLWRIAEGIRQNADLLAGLEGAEAGKPEPQSFREVAGAALYFEFFAGLGQVPSGEVLDIGPGMHGYTRREPYGVVGVITPWNAPLGQAARAVAPALLAGNAVIAKPSEYTSTTTLELARIASDAGLPTGVLNVVTGTGEGVGRAIVEHPGVRKIAFTGSLRAG